MPRRFCCYARPTSSFLNIAGQLSTGAANDSADLSAIDDFPVPGGQVMLNNMAGAMAPHCPPVLFRTIAIYLAASDRV